MKFNKTRESACDQCPFSITTPKEYLDTRGQNGGRFAAQACMNALLPCHMDDPDGIAQVDGKNRQCYGAAIFRTHINADVVEEILPKKPADPMIFKSIPHLVAHHYGADIDMVKGMMADGTILQNWITEEQLRSGLGNAFLDKLKAALIETKTRSENSE